MQVKTFHHIRTGKQTGGATVCVTGDTEKVGNVHVQVAYCHGGGGFKDFEVKSKEGIVLRTESRKFKGDPYCKDTGRKAAEASPSTVIPLRFLPSELADIQAKANKMSKRGWQEIPDFSFAIRRFLPKE